MTYQTWEPEQQSRYNSLQAGYIRDARELGYVIDRMVLCCGDDVPIGKRCGTLEDKDYEMSNKCGEITHAFDWLCICTPCHRVVHEVDEARLIAFANEPLRALGLYEAVEVGL